MNHIGEDVARRLLRLGRIDPRQIVGLAAGGPQLKPPGPGIELFRRIAGLDLVIAFLQPGVNEIADDIGDGRILAVLGEHDRRCELAQQRDKTGHTKAVVAHLDHMAQRAPLQLARQQFEKLAEIHFIEFLGRRELP
jgi:hypothetical protein